MAIVKFDRKNGHPSIEVVGASSAEKAFLAEFFDTFTDSRYKANHVFENCDGALRVGFKSFLNSEVLADLGFLAATEAIEKLIATQCTLLEIKAYVVENYISKTNGDATNYIVVAKDNRQAYSYTVKNDIVSEFQLQKDIAVVELKEMMQKIGL